MEATEAEVIQEEPTGAKVTEAEMMQVEVTEVELREVDSTEVEVQEEAWAQIPTGQTLSFSLEENIAYYRAVDPRDKLT